VLKQLTEEGREKSESKKDFTNNLFFFLDRCYFSIKIERQTFHLVEMSAQTREFTFQHFG
jgi:hypothetical protein